MLQSTRKEEIIKFLLEFKSLVNQGRYYVVNRTVNNQALIELGITYQIRKDIILGLTVIDYCYGPELDRDKPGKIWVFGAQINEEEIYIKLKTFGVGKSSVAKCISFHKALSPLRYPYREDPNYK